MSFAEAAENAMKEHFEKKEEKDTLECLKIGLGALFGYQIKFLNKIIRGQKKSGVIYLPMKYIGKEVIVLVKDES